MVIQQRQRQRNRRCAARHSKSRQPYPDYLRIGMAIKNALGDAGEGVFDTWARQSSKYNEAEQRKYWQASVRLRRTGPASPKGPSFTRRWATVGSFLNRPIPRIPIAILTPVTSRWMPSSRRSEARPARMIGPELQDNPARSQSATFTDRVQRTVFAEPDACGWEAVGALNESDILLSATAWWSVSPNIATIRGRLVRANPAIFRNFAAQAAHWINVSQTKWGKWSLKLRRRWWCWRTCWPSASTHYPR